MMSALRIATYAPDDYYFRERKDHFPTPPQKGAFALDEVIAKMPWQHEEVIRLHGMRFGFWNDWDVSARSETAEFVFIYFGNRRQ